MFRKSQNSAAVLEWVISFIFTFYVMSFFLDLFPAVRTGIHSQRTDMENPVKNSKVEQIGSYTNSHPTMGNGSEHAPTGDTNVDHENETVV
jgi:hypothetical protein